MGDAGIETWQEHVTKQMNLDIDWPEFECIKSLPVSPFDQTSNPYLLGLQIGHESNRDLLHSVAQELHAEGWVAIYTRMATTILERNLSLIRGRVLVQTLPSAAYSMEETLAHARLYTKEFHRLGVPRERFCIKILATGPGLNAARILQSEGIDTLGTAVFGVEQAVACSQARCLFISPYFNEVRSMRDPSLWPNVEDPATQHPFSRPLAQMVGLYKHLEKKTGQTQPLIKLAAFRSLKEVDAAARLGCHSATVTPAIFTELCITKYTGGSGKSQAAPFADQPQPLPLPLTELDLLAESGKILASALEADTVAGGRLSDAIDRFMGAEVSSKNLIESIIARNVE
ncbi:uncharacterized protein PV07_00917 [Cladophialophora immunda]|uniref:Transaldolase n=1 Tax=Cladophialophora immunda TaxID=569365 RepID=A0A0D2A148_9EURO|nr:uncharacterized protein PV07_00917 [Cladophialophora immunda]KIW34121.1 hypothetical protein PV07_00917 [Cladophialophora immunda]OQV05107.1 hypothetical protein CLAIMM_09900 [Cladophialophora immunda]